MAQDEREEMPTIVPMVAYEDPATAIDWLGRAFGFRERKDQRMKDRDGRITHAELRLGKGRVFLRPRHPTTRARSITGRRARPRANGLRSHGSSTGCLSTWTMSIVTSLARRARARRCFPISRTTRSGGYTGSKTSKDIGGCFSSLMRSEERRVGK